MSLILIFKDDKDINYLKNFNIKLNNIKILKIKENYVDDNFDYNIFFKELFSLKDIENNIIDLDIDIHKNNFYGFAIDENILENLNKLKKLENLKLNGNSAKNIFELKLKTLKTLNIDRCEKIYINGDTELSIKKLILSGNNISKSLLKLPQLEYLESSRSNFSSIDFNSLNNLKKLKFWLNKEFTQILSIKRLKEIHIISYDLEYLKNNLSLIHDKNTSVNKLLFYHYLNNDYKDEDYNINEILNKFPNLTELILITNLDNHRVIKIGFVNSDINLEIKEDSNCKINKITLFLYLGNIKVYCQNFKKLEKFEIKTNNKFLPIIIKNISNSIPMLSKNRNIKYNSLNELNLHLNLSQLINLEIFKNLNNNIDNMPNLKKIDLHFLTNIDRNTYEKFIKKILSLKIESTNINLCFIFYDENDPNKKFTLF